MSLLQKSPIKETMFCKKEPVILRSPTNRSHPIAITRITRMIIRLNHNQIYC